MVGGLAVALQKHGVHVSGTDAEQFPPMPGVLREAGIQVHDAWAEANLPAKVDAVVTGGMLQRGNPELEAALKRGLPVSNATVFLEQYFLRRSQNFVVTGTKGKTTTTAMLAWIFDRSGLAPDYLIGGQARAGLERLRLTGAPLMVLEGDEYRSGLGDPMPKFLRYHARHVIITNIQHDHHDQFPTPRSYEWAFWDLINSVPPDGSLTICADDPRVRALTGPTPVPVASVGFDRKAGHRLTAFRDGPGGARFTMDGQSFQLLLSGRMNAVDAALAAVAAGHVGISLKKAAAALASFPGVEERLDRVFQSGRTVVYADDAHHPVALRPLLESLRARHPGRRLVLFFQPRFTGGRRGLHQKELPQCLQSADHVVVTPVWEFIRFDEPFDEQLLCRQLRGQGGRATWAPSEEKVVSAIPKVSQPGDVVLLSFNRRSGAFFDQMVAALRKMALT